MLANIIRNSKKSVGGGGGGIVIDGGDPYYSAVSLMLSMDGTNGSTTFTDSSLNALTVTASGNAQISTTQSKYGGASAYFDGSGDYLSISDATRFNFGSGDFTVEFWFYNSNSADESKCLVAINNNNPSVGYAGIRVYYWLNNTIETLISSTGSSWAVIANTAAANSVSKNAWNHYAVVRSGNTIKIFLNGTQYISDKTMTGSVYSSSSHLVGGLIVSSSVTQTFNGYIDDLRISRFARYVSNFTPPTAALPTTASSTVADPYYNYTSLLLHMDGTNASTNFVDSGPNALAVTAAGNAQVSTTQSKYGGAAAYFDGTGDYLSLSGGMPSGTGTAFTIECWIRLDDLSAYRAITRTAGGLDIGVQPSGMIVCDQTGVGIIANSAAGVITAGTWYHVAVTRDTSNNYKIYVNGTQVASATNAFSATAATTIGFSAFSGAHYFKGYIDDFRVTNALRYTANFTPPTSAFPNA
jgi:hypothetical protein